MLQASYDYLMRAGLPRVVKINSAEIKFIKYFTKIISKNNFTKLNFIFWGAGKKILFTKINFKKKLSQK